jgi:hypothetical protein
VVNWTSVEVVSSQFSLNHSIIDEPAHTTGHVLRFSFIGPYSEITWRCFGGCLPVMELSVVLLRECAANGFHTPQQFRISCNAFIFIFHVSSNAQGSSIRGSVTCAYTRHTSAPSRTTRWVSHHHTYAPGTSRHYSRGPRISDVLPRSLPQGCTSGMPPSNGKPLSFTPPLCLQRDT